MKQRNAKIRDRGTGSSLIETVCGSVVLVVVALFLIDVAAIVICQTENDALAKHCARAAAAQPSLALATTAITDVTTQFVAQNGGSKLCTYIDPPTTTYSAANATVNVITTVQCTFPVPIPFGPTSIQFQTDATEPIVAILPPTI